MKRPPVNGPLAIMSRRVPTRSRCGQGAGGPSSDSARWAVIPSSTSPAPASSSSVPSTWRATTIRQSRREFPAGGDLPVRLDSPTPREHQRWRPRHYRHRRTGLTGHRSCRYLTERHPHQNCRTRSISRCPPPALALRHKERAPSDGQTNRRPDKNAGGERSAVPREPPPSMMRADSSECGYEIPTTQERDLHGPASRPSPLGECRHTQTSCRTNLRAQTGATP